MDSSVLILAAVVAAAVVVQLVTLVGLLRALRRLSARLETLGVSLQSDVASASEKAIELMASIQATSDKMRTIEEHVAATTEIVRKRAADLDVFVADTTNAARLQIIRLQEMLDTASRRIEDTLDLVHNGILAPVSEVNALVRGLRVGINFFLRSRRKSSGLTHPEDEMFI